MSDYEKIRRMFVYGMSAITYYHVILPEVHDLHKAVRHMDSVATLMLKRGDLIRPPQHVRSLANRFEFADGMDSFSFNVR